MTKVEPILPWVEGQEDRLFKRLTIAFVVIFVVLGVFMSRIQLPEVERKQLSDVSPRLAKLILEKKKIPPPPPPPPLKKVIKKEEPKAVEPEKKAEPKKEPVIVKPLSKEQSRAAAKEKASKTGLIALKDELADLRESFDFSDIAELPQLKTGTQAEKVKSASELLSASAAAGSGGLRTSEASSRRIESTGLNARKTTSVESRLEAEVKADPAAKTRVARVATRTQEEIERVFQKNKGSIFSIYNRELRKDPSLQGKVIVELTIEPDGSVSKCVIVSSELGNEKLEKRLVSKIGQFKFAASKVSVITVTYPIDFLPS